LPPPGDLADDLDRVEAAYVINPASLDELESHLRRDFSLLNLPPANWVTPRPPGGSGSVLDVAVIGAGMAGLTAAFALIKLGIRNIRLFDRAPSGSEGPWATYARMETLRSPKQLTGPSLGFANLTFRAWFEAQFGGAAWEAVDKIPRLQWMDYLRWYRRVLDLPVENGVSILDVGPGDDGTILLRLRDRAGERRVSARRVVLATGRDGLGGPFIPEIFRDLPKSRWAHSSDVIDFPGLAGKSVAVIGAGSSAVDNAAEALEAGAGPVVMLARRPEIPRINKGLAGGNAGVVLGFYDLLPEQRWAMTQYVADCQVPPPRGSMLRVSRHDKFAIWTDCPVTAARTEGERVVLETKHGEARFDFVILGTGFTVDWVRRPELARLAPLAALWRDRFLPDGAGDHPFAAQPFLGPAFEFTERVPGASPWIERVHCFNFGGMLSHGKVTGDIPGISVGAERLAAGLARAFFTEDYADHFQRLVDFETPELLGDEWRPSDPLCFPGGA
jgi:cation diffusion facilitator CzcD-associated flavoprotein CzcO